MAELKIKALLEKITRQIRKNKLKGATGKLYGYSNATIAIGSGSTTGSTYTEIVPRGVLNTDFKFATNNTNIFAYSTHASSTSSVKYPQIMVKRSGLYLMQGSVYFSTSYTAEDRIYIVFYINNEIPVNTLWVTERMSSTYQIIQLERLYYLTAGDVVQMRASNYTSAGRGNIYQSESTQLILTLMNPTL